MSVTQIYTMPSIVMLTASLWSIRSGDTDGDSYLLSGDDIPECGTYQCPLTVKHILMECVDFNDV